MSLEITRIESLEFRYAIPDVGTDGNGFNLVYDPGETTSRKLFAVRIHTDAGPTGAYAASPPRRWVLPIRYSDCTARVGRVIMTSVAFYRSDRPTAGGRYGNCLH
jgi:hypothetical protein